MLTVRSGHPSNTHRVEFEVWLGLRNALAIELAVAFAAVAMWRACT